MTTLDYVGAPGDYFGLLGTTGDYCGLLGTPGGHLRGHPWWLLVITGDYLGLLVATRGTPGDTWVTPGNSLKLQPVWFKSFYASNLEEKEY